jgi:hypothetical protein
LQVRQGQCQGFAHGRVIFGFEALLQEWQLLRLSAALQAFGRRKAFGRVIGEQLVAG